MTSYPSYDALAVDLDLNFFDKVSILKNAGNQLNDGSWFVITDDGHCHLFDKDGNLDDINKITAFAECFIRKDIKKIIIPDSVTCIGNWAFWKCCNLMNVVMSNSVAYIGNNAFGKCSSLSSITISSSLKNIENSTFYGCENLTYVTIPNSVINIGRNAFYGCSRLTNVAIGNNVINIRDYAFEQCSSLTKVVIPDSVQHIGNAFVGCSMLRHITFGNKVNSIYEGAFYGCWSLTSFDVKALNPNLKSTNGLLLSHDGTSLISVPTGLTNVMIPDTVTNIGESAFYECIKLTHMTIPSSVINIGSFSDCKNIKSICFKGKTLKQVKAMKNYPWGIKDGNIITAEFE